MVVSCDRLQHPADVQDVRAFAYAPAAARAQRAARPSVGGTHTVYSILQHEVLDRMILIYGYRYSIHFIKTSVSCLTLLQLYTFIDIVVQTV